MNHLLNHSEPERRRRCTRSFPLASDLTVIPLGYLANASHYGLTKEANSVVASLNAPVGGSDVEALAAVLMAKGVEDALSRHAAAFACALLALADAHEHPPEPVGSLKPSNFEDHFNSLFGAVVPRGKRKVSLVERMPAYVRRAAVDCALSSGWSCIATLATVDPVCWRAICFALSDTFSLKLKTLEAMTLSSLHRARTRVGA